MPQSTKQVYRCEQCQKSFLTKTKLSSHVSVIHNNEKDFDVNSVERNLVMIKACITMKWKSWWRLQKQNQTCKRESKISSKWAQMWLLW